jgi:hypothetical protein
MPVMTKYIHGQAEAAFILLIPFMDGATKRRKAGPVSA